MKVVFFQRKPFKDFCSIEHVFDMVRAELPTSQEYETQVSTFQSKGIWRRIYNMTEAAFRQGDVNHITGDVNFLAFFLNSKKTILSAHGTFIPNKNKLIRRIYDLIWWQLPLKKVKSITVVSNFLKKELIERFHCEEEKIEVIYNPVNPIFQPEPRPFSDKPILLQVGTKPAKNIERLLEALEGINCRLHIIGNLSPQQKYLIEKFKIDFINSSNLKPEQMKTAYENSDIVTLISTYEGFGMPIIEANAIGRPVITGNTAAMPEVAGNAALQVDPFNVQSIRKGIFQLIENENFRSRLIDNGFENVKRFEVKAIARVYYELYRRV